MSKKPKNIVTIQKFYNNILGQQGDNKNNRLYADKERGEDRNTAPAMEDVAHESPVTIGEKYIDRKTSRIHERERYVVWFNALKRSSVNN